jgi:hypothetical protein
MQIRAALLSIASLVSVGLSAQAQASDGYFCIFERKNSQYQRVDAYRSLAYSESTACYEAERQCRYEMRAGQSCRQFSAGEYGWIERQTEVLCESREGRRTKCRLGGAAISEPVLYHRHSDSPCTHNESFGVEQGSDSMWVDKGCRGDFHVEVRAYVEPDNPPFPDTSDDDSNDPHDMREILRCVSNGYGTSYCSPQNWNRQIVEIQIQQELYGSRGCWEGSSFGIDRGQRIWVSNGCKADFELFLR